MALKALEKLGSNNRKGLLYKGMYKVSGVYGSYWLIIINECGFGGNENQGIRLWWSSK